MNGFNKKEKVLFTFPVVVAMLKKGGELKFFDSKEESDACYREVQGKK